jgi:UDPglucose--hexose-1-phosphate uridylyltransferase
MELRKDYILDRYVIVSSSRGNRPFEFKREEEVKRTSVDYFAPGNEYLTPPEIGRINEDSGWKIRWFANKFSAVELNGDPVIRTDNNYFTFAAAYGYHEVIVETPDSEKQLCDLDVGHIKDVLRVYGLRIQELSQKPYISYVSVFKNHGKDAGTSLFHSHSQVIAYNKFPNLVREKIAAVKRYQRCPYCDIINIEKGSYRRCFENESFVAFTPYASRYHFEIWVFPKNHVRNINELNDSHLNDLAYVLKQILLKLKSISASYNMALFYSPAGEDLHFHIEICPKMAIFGGFELLTNDVINSVSPEDAARFYRGEV